MYANQQLEASVSRPRPVAALRGAPAVPLWCDVLYRRDK